MVYRMNNKIYRMDLQTLEEGTKAPQRFADDLKYIRKFTGMSLRALARSVGTEPSNILRWERGQRCTRIDIYEIIRRQADLLRT